MGDFLFFGTKKYFFGVKIQKNIENYAYEDTKKYLYIFIVQLVIESAGTLPDDW